MKQLLLIFSFFLTSLSFTTTGQCIDNAGHVMGDIDSIHINKCDWFVDTSYVRVARLVNDAYEYSVYPADCDTTFFTCVRCDSFVAEPSQEVRRFIRSLQSVPAPRPPEPEASYKVYTAMLSQSSTDAPTANVLENTVGTITWTRDATGFYFGTCTSCFTENKTFILPFSSTFNMDVFAGYEVLIYRYSASEIAIYTYAAGSAADDILGWQGLGAIEIRVYP